MRAGAARPGATPGTISGTISGTAPASAARFGSLALPAIMERFAGRRDCRVLDLGPSFGANVEFFSRCASRIVIEDLYRTLAALGGPHSGPDRSCCPLYEALLPYREPHRPPESAEPFDLILLWNLLDYLEREDIRRLSDHLAALSRRGTLLYALVSTRQRIPETPDDYKIADDNSLTALPTATAQRDGPRHSQVRLLELMRKLRVQRSFLLRDGMQEYLFEPA